MLFGLMYSSFLEESKSKLAAPILMAMSHFYRTPLYKKIALCQKFMCHSNWEWWKTIQLYLGTKTYFLARATTLPLIKSTSDCLFFNTSTHIDVLFSCLDAITWKIIRNSNKMKQVNNLVIAILWNYIGENLKIK